MNNKLTNEQIVLESLQKVVNNGEILDNKLFIKEIDLIVTTEIVSIKTEKDFVMAELIFSINNGEFNDVFIESTAGIGKSEEEALKQCSVNFALSCLLTFIDSMNNRYSETFETHFFESKKWNLTKSDLQCMGDSIKTNITDFWEIFGGKLKKRLGNKKYNWVKIFICKTSDNNYICECRINGTLNLEITNDLRNLAEYIDFSGNFISLKQFFIIKQSDETYKKVPYSKDDIINFSNKAIEIIANCDSKEKFDNMLKDISKITNDENLAFELKIFIPEILCELIFSEGKYIDKIMFINNDRNIEVYKNQFTSYYNIYESVSENLYNRKITKESIKKIICLSATYDAIEKVLKENKQLSNFRAIGVGMRISDKYRPF